MLDPTKWLGNRIGGNGEVTGGGRVTCTMKGRPIAFPSVVKFNEIINCGEFGVIEYLSARYRLAFDFSSLGDYSESKKAEKVSKQFSK